MTEKKANLGASVTARLLNRAKETGDDYQVLLASHCFERFLYRLGVSGLRDRFVLKGALLLRTWSEQPYRATRDLDLLRRGDGSPDAIRRDLEAICATRVDADGVTFDTGGIRIDAIREGDEYAGTRVSLPAACGSARLTLQVDVGVGDSVWPTPEFHAYPTILDLPVRSGSTDVRTTWDSDSYGAADWADYGVLGESVEAGPGAGVRKAGRAEFAEHGGRGVCAGLGWVSVADSRGDCWRNAGSWSLESGSSGVDDRTVGLLLGATTAVSICSMGTLDRFFREPMRDNHRLKRSAARRRVVHDDQDRVADEKQQYGHEQARCRVGSQRRSCLFEIPGQ